MQNLTKTLAIASFLTPMTAHSLGIGELKLHSALNQKLNAEISLKLDAGENIADIKVSLASHEQYTKLGISWSYFISKVKFKPILKANGSAVIKMTSDIVLEDPILDFLMELSWPSGDIYKEFTVFIDPPSSYPQHVAVTPSVATRKIKRTSQAAPVKTTKNDLNRLALEGEYGPTSRNDSLWKVAEKVRADNNVSIEQMMMALYKANPQAFYKKNVNALMEGKSLKVPEKADVLKLSKSQAQKSFSRQMAIWQGKPVPEEEVAIVMLETHQDSPLEDSDKSKLTLESPSDESISQLGPLTAYAAESEVLVAENQQLQERLANLEKQFAIMQEMMAIKDQQLAALQNSKLPLGIQATKAIGLDAVAKTEVSNEKGKRSTDDSAMNNVLAGQPELLKNKGQSIEEKVIPKDNKALLEADSPSTEQDSGFNYNYLFGGLFVALGFVWLFGRKRQAEEEINENSMFSTVNALQDNPASQQQKMVPDVDKKTVYDTESIGESSFLSEFSSADFDVFETDPSEVDPSSETDVYLAYGRYQQAEELMRQAISEQPENDDYKLKLLEIFYVSENKASFQNYAEELDSLGKKSEINFWSKVTGMGSELIPDSELFSSSQGAAQFAVTELAADDYLTAATEVPSAAQSKAVTEAMDSYNSEVSDLVEFDNNLDTVSGPEQLASDIESIDFDLSKFETLEPEGIQADPVANDEQSIDFNLSDSDVSFAETMEEQFKQLSSNNDFDFDFDETSADSINKESANTSDPESDHLGVSDLTDRDEFETKIDLAKAYIDMGDLSSAISIAQDVLERGSLSQKEDALIILKKLS